MLVCGLAYGSGCSDDKDPIVSGPDSGTSSSTSGGPGGGPGGDPGGDPSGEPTAGGSGDLTGGDTGEPAGPHALATIMLGENHLSTGGSSTPFVSAVFIPDATAGAAEACTEKVAGCELALVPECGNTGCNSGEFCGFDDACTAKCLPICDASCADDEVCYFPSPGTTGCKKLESFDGGALSFLGTPIPITLFPPYVFMGDVGAPFSPGAMATVQGSGAANAGYEAFEKDFVGTEFIQTNPTLDKIAFADVFGTKDIPVKWTPGTGTVTITANVSSADFQFGTITCPADDAKGSFAVPRGALEAAIGGSSVSGLTLTITRTHTDRHVDLTTKGMLTGQTVQPIGWLEIITSSSESHTFMGCDPGEAVCDNECVDVQYDDQNCGDCGKACPGTDFCSEGVCSGETSCNTCYDAAQTGVCKPENDACAADVDCKALETCLQGCGTQTCVDTCAMNATQEAIDLFNAQFYCACDQACVQECMDLCA